MIFLLVIFLNSLPVVRLLWIVARGTFIFLFVVEFMPSLPRMVIFIASTFCS